MPPSCCTATDCLVVTPIYFKKTVQTQYFVPISRDEFGRYVSKALDSLTRNIAQTSEALQSNKWLQGAKTIHEAVEGKRSGQQTKGFREWVGIQQEVQELTAGTVTTTRYTSTVEPFLKDHPISHKNMVSQVWWSLVPGSVALEHGACQECVVL